MSSWVPIACFEMVFKYLKRDLVVYSILTGDPWREHEFDHFYNTVSKTKRYRQYSIDEMKRYLKQLDGEKFHHYRFYFDGEKLKFI